MTIRMERAAVVEEPYLNVSDSPLNVCQTGRRVGADVGEDHTLLVVVLAQNAVLCQVEAITNAEPESNRQLVSWVKVLREIDNSGGCLRG